jgi:hypothetical protein
MFHHENIINALKNVVGEEAPAVETADQRAAGGRGSFQQSHNRFGDIYAMENVIADLQRG